MNAPPPLEILAAGEPFRPWLGVFETLCVARGRALFVEEHWQSLQESCAALGLACESDFRRAARALPAGAEGRWRWVVPADGPARQLFHAEPPPRPGRGLTLQLSAVRVGSANWDARFKTLSYLAHAQARRENPRGETLLLNERGHVASGAMTNIFWIRDGRLFTPDTAAGCRAGVTRAWVLANAPAAGAARPRCPAGGARRGGRDLSDEQPPRPLPGAPLAGARTAGARPAPAPAPARVSSCLPGATAIDPRTVGIHSFRQPDARPLTAPPHEPAQPSRSRPSRHRRARPRHGRRPRCQSSGHLGLPLGCAEIGAVLFGHALRHCPDAPGMARTATASCSPPATARCSSTPGCTSPATRT